MAFIGPRLIKDSAFLKFKSFITTSLLRSSLCEKAPSSVKELGLSNIIRIKSANFEIWFSTSRMFSLPSS